MSRILWNRFHIVICNSTFPQRRPIMKNACGTSILVFLASLVSSAILLAQSDLGTISGFIKDPSGASIPNADVTIKNQTGIERRATTNESGFYTITNIPPGLYRMSAEASGFQKYESTDNKLDPSGRLSIDATLTVGVSTETVEVTATTAALQTESAAVQKLNVSSHRQTCRVGEIAANCAACVREPIGKAR